MATLVLTINAVVLIVIAEIISVDLSMAVPVMSVDAAFFFRVLFPI